MKALIVDDCALTREILALGIHGIAEIDFAENGQQAVDLVQKTIAEGNRYDLICLDISMPVLGGHAALKTIRALESASGGKKAKAFMITASSDPDDMIAAIEEGECDDYLTKPVMRHSFMELLRKHELIS